MANIIRLGGGAGGSQPTLISKSITQNGTYNAVDDSADGYSSVEVNVAGGGGSFIPMITSSGSQYIELPINGNGDYTYKFKMYVPATQQEKLIFGSSWNVNARLFHFMPSYLSYYINSSPTNMPYNTGILDIEASTDYIIINQIKYTGTATARSSGNIKLFGISGSSNAGVMGIGRFKVYNNSDDSLVMDLVPMEDSNTGAGYFHDTVGNTDYYSNSNTDLQYAEIYDGGSVEFKNYLKFNGYGIVLPWTLNSDYKIEVVFHETTYLQDSAIIGNTYNERRSNLTEYNNAYFTSTGTSGSGFGSWSAGEHTFITNNGNGKNEFDGVEVTNYTPTTDSTINYAIGWRATAGNAFKGWIKSYKVYSISSGDLLHELKPALVMNSPCLYDTIENKIYSTSLVEAVDTIA